MKNKNQCQDCKYFQSLMTNTNFGKCKFPNTVDNNSLFDSETILAGLGMNTNIPIVHKEDSYSCFESK